MYDCPQLEQLSFSFMKTLMLTNQLQFHCTQGNHLLSTSHCNQITVFFYSLSHTLDQVFSSQPVQFDLCIHNHKYYNTWELYVLTLYLSLHILSVYTYTRQLYERESDVTNSLLYMLQSYILAKYSIKILYPSIQYKLYTASILYIHVLKHDCIQGRDSVSTKCTCF